MPMKGLQFGWKRNSYRHQFDNLLQSNIMLFPLKNLIEYSDNMYEVTTAASRRAYQLSSVMEKDEKDDYDGKMVALAAYQVFNQEVQFRLESE
jgi:DNA-directed RNA polymerase subunit omega